MQARAPRERGGRRWRRRSGAAAAVLALWLALTGAATALLPLGLALAAATVWADPLRRFRGFWLPRPLPLLLYLPGFAVRSFLGGVDVARRVFDPHLPIGPAFHDHRAEATRTATRASHMAAISLLPGSLGAGTDGAIDRVHVLTEEPRAIAAIAAEERRIRRVFGEESAS